MIEFGCFGGTCAVDVDGPGAPEARRDLLSWHARFTRFDPASELSRLNADPRIEVPVTPLMARLVAAAIWAAETSGGLVDATLLGDLERAGYSEDLRTSLDLREALARAAARRRPASPAPVRPPLAVDFERMVVRRPPGLRLDAGGLAKGVFADALAERLDGRPAFAIDCAGDLRVGGRERPVHVRGPFDGELLHTFRLADSGVATSGIGRRSWAGPDGRPAHHLLDPATGQPAFTGIVQATAFAPTALEAEVRAKAAVLSGPDRAAGWLPYGGLVVHDDASHAVVGPLFMASGGKRQQRLGREVGADRGARKGSFVYLGVASRTEIHQIPRLEEKGVSRCPAGRRDTRNSPSRRD